MVFGRMEFRRQQEVEDILQNCIASIFGNDWFSRNDQIRYGGIPGLMSGVGGRNIEGLMIDDLIRKHNLVVQLTNNFIDPHASYAEVHPKVIDYGSGRGGYPRDFERPTRLELFMSMDNITLDRILDAYGIGGRSLASYPGFTFGLFSGLDPMRGPKINALLEYLGLNLNDYSRRERSRSPRRLGFSADLPARIIHERISTQLAGPR